MIAITGGVAAGKSVLAAELGAAVAAWPERPNLEIVCTDGFLFDNATLEARGLSLRKGFPESYDLDGMKAALAGVREGPTRFPAYSHTTYDVDPALAREVATPDVLIVDGLGLSVDLGVAADGRRLIDVLIYLDADEADLELWFTERLLGLWRAAEHDPTSFYARFRHLDEASARAFAAGVWQAINLPNLRDHIAPGRALADIVVRKRRDHAIATIDAR